MRPFVSLCTPTFNRRPFIPYIMKCVQHQTYPADRMEWIIVDDGTDPIGDLVEHLPNVKYIRLPSKVTLGVKRNIMHTYCSGDILVYMDDDDYYPPERVEHAVERLTLNPDKLIAGSSEMHIYYASVKQLYQVGPYRENHATAATFAFKKELLTITKYDSTSAIAEESQFTNQYSIPMVQLDPLKTILVCSHPQNTLNKETILENLTNFKCKLSKYHVTDFIKNKELEQFYIHRLKDTVNSYSEGSVENKPDVQMALKHLNERKEWRNREMQLVNECERVKQQYQVMEQLVLSKNKLIDELLNRLKDEKRKNNK